MQGWGWVRVGRIVERPRLSALLDSGASGPVTLLCAAAGSGKTTAVRSWLAERGVGAVAWVAVNRGEADAVRFWSSVMSALRHSGAVGGDDALATLVPAPLGGEREFVARLIEGIGQLSRPVVLVLDDVHELRSDAALAGVERLVETAPPQLRLILLSRRDPKLGLHRLRLSGGLVEIRGDELGFTAEESRALLAEAGVAVGDDDAARLHQRTEGWAAGLRLAALSLARHEAPGRFVAEFAGSERTVAEYLLGEVLARQPAEVRHLLLRTCILDRVCGELADALTGRDDGARVLAELEEANALVVAADVGRSWYRYHHLLADLLRLELRREAPGEVAGLHRRAAEWLAAHGATVDAIRHAQRAGDDALAGELLGRHWAQLLLDGEDATLRELLAGLRSDDDPEVAAIAAAARLTEGRWAQADALLAHAREGSGALPEERRERAATALATVSLLRARMVGDLRHAPDDVERGDDELHALALMNLGAAEVWMLRLDDGEAHLERGLALAERLGRPYLEVGCLGALGTLANMTNRLGLAEERLRRAVAVADRVGWTTHPMVGVAYMNLAAVLLDRGRLAEGEEWLARAAPILTGANEPAATVGLCHAQGMLAFARGDHAAALAAFTDGERAVAELRSPHFLGVVERQWQQRARLALGEPVEAPAPDGNAQARNLTARVRLAAGDAEGALAALEQEGFGFHANVEIEGLLLEALAHAGLGGRAAATRATERALDLAEPQGHVWIALTIPGVEALLRAHPSHETAHAAFLRELLDHLAGASPAPVAALTDPLSERELAVLRFLPTNLSAGDIGGELFLSVHTVKTHMRKLYAKLDVHTRAEAVERGRELGLLAR
jgi:LuxR family transcriptional regulator, maltose regulon positive regulatory protein